MNTTSVHVEYTSPQWRVRVSDEAIPRSHHMAKDAAVRAAKTVAGQLRAELVVHDIDGAVALRVPRSCDAL